MTPPGKGPKLPFGLLQQIGSTKRKGPRQNHNTSRTVSRKSNRKDDRNRKQSHSGNRVKIADRGPSRKDGALADSRKQNLRSTQKMPNPPNKETIQGSDPDSGSGLVSGDAMLSDFDENEDEDDSESVDLNEDNAKTVGEEGDTEDGDDDEAGDRSGPRISSKAVRDRLAKDDAEIAALERKLGVRARKLPKPFQDDGLGDLLGDVGSESRHREQVLSSKRKFEDEEWLARKRKKASNSERVGLCKKTNGGDGRLGAGPEIADDDDFELNLEYAEAPDDDADDVLQSLDSDEYGGFESADTASSTPEPAICRSRENPYVAPSTGNVARYVPPAARQNSETDAELMAKIRRQAQGMMNRMSDSNMPAILGDVENLFRDYPRHHVSSTLVTLLLTRVCESAAVLDKYLAMYGGFATAIYRLHGVDFGAALIQGVVDSFDRHYQAAVRTSPGSSTKEALNLVGFISQLYSFQLIGANLIFDYIRLLLGDLSELNAELLLRVVRTSGSSLRQDDPLALKDIVALIRPAVARVGEENISVRTKFMIETINDLKNNKAKANTTSAKHGDHTTHMKKLLGSLKSRKLKSTEPLRIGLQDIRESDRKGKWWLVGATWIGKSQDGAGERSETGCDEEDGDSHGVLTGEDADLPDLWKLAREQNLNTGAQQAIFVALLSSADYEEACAKIHKLRLNKDRRGEISTVLLQCVGAEEHYNPYYTLAAGKLCSADRKIKYSFQDSLWKFFRRLGQPLFDDEMDEADEDESIDVRRIVNVAKMFGSLVARGVLGLSILRCLDMTYLRTKPKMFVEVMLVSCLLELGEGAVARVFGAEMQELARGLRWFLRVVVRKTDLVDDHERKAFRSSCKGAEKALRDALVDVGHASVDV